MLNSDIVQLLSFSISKVSLCITEQFKKKFWTKSFWTRVKKFKPYLFNLISYILLYKVFDPLEPELAKC